jgi:hypothetical protein
MSKPIPGIFAWRWYEPLDGTTVVSVFPVAGSVYRAVAAACATRRQ